jgi:hypothetical protein
MSLTTENDWGVITTKLDGVLVRDGEQLYIVYPDTYVERVTVKCRVQRGTVSDHGKDYSTESSIPTVTLDVHGHPLTVDLYSLRGLPICRR